MRNTQYHVDHASKSDLIAEYTRIQSGTSLLSRKFRDMIVKRVENNGWQPAEKPNNYDVVCAALQNVRKTNSRPLMIVISDIVYGDLVNYSLVYPDMFRVDGDDLYLMDAKLVTLSIARTFMEIPDSVTDSQFLITNLKTD